MNGKSDLPAPSACRSIAIGIPTFLDRPQTTAFLPKVIIPVRQSKILKKYLKYITFQTM